MRRILTLAGVAALALVMTTTPAYASGRPLDATLTGAAEIPGPGDGDGGGTAELTVNPGLGEICYTLTVTGVAPIAAAHIHRGSVTQSGGVVVPLDPPTTGTVSACEEVDRALAKEILQTPEAFYVNVHNADFPGGALRGQLG